MAWHKVSDTEYKTLDLLRLGPRTIDSVAESLGLSTHGVRRLFNGAFKRNLITTGRDSNSAIIWRINPKLRWLHRNIPLIKAPDGSYVGIFSVAQTSMDNSVRAIKQIPIIAADLYTLGLQASELYRLNINGELTDEQLKKELRPIKTALRNKKAEYEDYAVRLEVAYNIFKQLGEPRNWDPSFLANHFLTMVDLDGNLVPVPVDVETIINYRDKFLSEL